MSFELDPAFLVPDEDSLRALFPATHEAAIQKCQTRLDKYARDYIRRSPFLCLGTQDQTGKADVSPRGDPAGFVTVLDDRTLAIPDRPGNNRLDSLTNILSNPAVGLLFIVPGFDDTLRVNGHARLTTAPDLLETMRVNDRLPRLAIVVDVSTVFLHCAKAFRRSHLWDPTRHQDRSELPSLLNMVHEQTTGAAKTGDAARALDDALEEAYRTTMY